MSGREEIRVPGLAEPISHYTDAVRAGDLLFVSGCIAGRRRRAGSSAGRRRRAGAAGLREHRGDPRRRRRQLRRRRQGHRLPHRRRRPPAVNTVRQEVFGATRPASTLVEVSQLAIPGARIEIEAVALHPVTDSLQRGDHGGRAGAAAARAAARAAPGRQGPDRHRGRSARPTARGSTPTTSRRDGDRGRAAVAAGAVVVGKANLHEFAWGVTSQNPWYGTVQNPRAPGPDDRRLVGRQRRRARRGPVRPRARHRHGLLDPPARRRAAASSA